MIDTNSTGKVIYVVHEHPSTTQTFVEDEWRELLETRGSVFVYPLHLPRDRASVQGVQACDHILDWKAKGTSSAIRKLVGGVIPSLFCKRGRVFIQSFFDRRSIVRLPYVVWCTARLLAALDDVLGEGDDVHIHAHFFGRTLEVGCLAALCRPRTARVSATGHAADVSAPMSRRRLKLLLTDFCDCVVAASETVNATISELYGVPSTVIHCGLPDPVFSGSAEAVGGSRILVSSVGRLVEKKGFATLIDAIGLCVSSGLDVHLEVGGDGPLLDELVLHSAKLGLSDRVRFLGKLSRREVFELIDRSQLFCLACEPGSDGDIDGIPVVLMEAMARKRSVISTHIGGIPELVIDGETGQLVSYDDRQGLARAIERIVVNGGLSEMLVKNAYEIVWTNFRLKSEVLRLRAEVIDAQY